MKSQVLIARAEGMTEETIAQAIRDLGLAERLAKARTIVVKPNLCAGAKWSEESGVVVGRPLLKQTLQALRRYNRQATIYIAESDSAGGTYAYEKFAFQGYEEFVQQIPGVALLDLSRDRLQTVELDGLFFRRMALSETLLQADFLVSLTRMKTHAITTITGILKNQFGCLPEEGKWIYHPYLEKVLCDVNRAVRTDLSIADGHPAMEGNGPVYGTLRDLKVVLLGNDPVATDAVMAYLMGFDPRRIGVLLRANQVGLGQVAWDHIEVSGLDPAAVRAPVRFVSWQRRFLVRVGLSVQKLGWRLAEVGHTWHNYHSLGQPVRELYWKIRSQIGQRLPPALKQQLKASLRRNPPAPPPVEKGAAPNNE